MEKTYECRYTIDYSIGALANIYIAFFFNDSKIILLSEKKTTLL